MPYLKKNSKLRKRLKLIFSYKTNLKIVKKIGLGIIYKVLSFSLKRNNDLLFLVSLSRLF